MEILQGDLLLEPGEIVVFRSWTDLQNESDLGVYIDGSDFESAEKMVDFIQWGTPKDVGRSDVAASKQIWPEISPGVYDFIQPASGGHSIALRSSNGGTAASDFGNGEPTQGTANPTSVPSESGIKIFLPTVMR